jgi:protein-S-isoprenylcysteine O-methyltransferase Ste14
MLVGAVVAHHDAAALAAAAMVVVALGVRITSEERQVAARYPDYADYARRTRRLLPWIL